MRQDLSFKTRDGTELRGWLYPAEGADGARPLVVMSHGLTAQFEFGLEPIAETLQAAGLAVLAYDHRGWGRSGGQPRMETNPFLQMHDTRDAITCATLLPGIDEQRIGLWGTSFSGGTALMVAAVDRRVRSVVAVCPFISGSTAMRRQMGDANFAAHLETMAKTRKEEMASGEVQHRQHSTHAESIAWFTSADRDGQWQNRISTLSHDMLLEYEPGDYAHRIAPTPLLMIVARNDTRAPTDLQVEAYHRAREPKRIVFIEGGHYDPYTRQRDHVGRTSRDWFLQTLAPEAPLAAGF